MALVPKQGRVPAGFLGMMVIVLIVESFVASRPILFSCVSSLNRKFSVGSASKHAKGHDVLFLGDSLVKLGLLPKVVEARSGLTAFNLASASGPASSTYNVLRRSLESGAEPRAIVVDFGTGLLTRDPEKDVRNSSEVLSLGEVVDLLRTARSVPLVTTLAIRSALPSVRRRVEIRQYLQAIWKGERYRQADVNLACYRNWWMNDGAHVAAPSQREDGEMQDDSADTSSPGRVHVHRVNRDYIDRIFTLAASRGIRVFWLLPPESPKSRATRKRQGVEASYTAFARSMQARHPEITILDARRSGYEQSVFFDAVHLDARGAVALSTTIADQLAVALLDAPRTSQWVSLPSPTKRPTGPMPEDFEQSKLALGIDLPALETNARVVR